MGILGTAYPSQKDPWQKPQIQAQLFRLVQLTLGAFFMIHLLSQFLDQFQDWVLEGAADEGHR